MNTHSQRDSLCHIILLFGQQLRLWAKIVHKKYSYLLQVKPLVLK